MEQYTLEQMRDYYLVAMEAENLSPKTRLGAKSNLTKFFEYLKNQSHLLKLADLTIHDARRYVTSLQGSITKYEGHPLNPAQPEAEYKESTVWSHARTLKAWSNWMGQEGYTPKPLFELLKMPKKGNYKPQILSPDEVQKVLGANHRDTLLGSRNYAIVLVFLDTAIRAGELVGMKLNNIAWDDGIIEVHGKGNKERFAPITPLTLKALRDYMQIYRPQPADPHVENVFLSLKGEPLQVNAIVHLMWHLRKASGVKRLHAHLLRHTSAAYYTYAGGVTPRVCNRFLGTRPPAPP